MKQWIAVLIFLAVPALGFAQGGPEEPDFRFEVGAGSYFGAEGDRFQASHLRASVASDLIELDMPAASVLETGLYVEAGYDGGLEWSVWGLSRMVRDGIVMGTDFKIADSGPGAFPDIGASFNFDVRVVMGVEFSERLTGYLFLLEDERPVAFQVTFGF